MTNPVELLWANALPGGTLSDGHAVLRYQEIPDAINALGILLCGYDLSNSQCVFIQVHNDTAHAFILSYFLTLRINCFLGSDGVPVPPFCDWIITARHEDGREWALPGRWQVMPNAACVKSDTIAPGAGKVFFASSGTTGVPKYIMHQSARLLQNAGAVADRFDIGPGTKVMVPVPVHHMYGFGAGFLPAVMTGADCLLIDRNNIIRLLTGLNSFQPDLVLLTPAVCKMMLLLKKEPAVTPLYITAGDKMNKEACLAFEQRFGKLVNLYGCTELGAIAVSEETAGSQQRSAGIVRPLKDASIRIGHTGLAEIQCRHAAGFEGYVNANGQPLAGRQEEWFATRDMGMDTGNGTFAIAGRADHCVNRLGFLVSFKEIENAIENLFHNIHEAVIVPDNQETLLGRRIIAFCHCTGGHEPDPELVKKTCQEKLPRQLVPDDFCFLEQLPRLHNGKPDRLALAAIITH